MTLSPFSSRLGSFVAAVAVSSTLLFVAPQAHAAKPTGVYYKAELAQSAPSKKELIRGVVVRCTDSKCVAPVASSADKNMCVSIAREFGEVTAFSAGDRVFDAEQVATCNNKGNAAVARK